MKTMTPKNLFVSFLTVIISMLMLMNVCRAEVGSEGKEFYLAFQPNYTGAGGALSLFISGEQDTQGTVEIVGLNFSTTFTVMANKITTVPIPLAAEHLPLDKVSKLAVHVVSQEKVTVYGFNRWSGTTDGFLALPVDALGLEYYALSYPTAYVMSQLTLIGAFDNTQVTVTPTTALGSHIAGKSFVISLNRGETYMLGGGGDLSGTRVVASAPIVVMAGADAVHIPTGYAYVDHIVETMPPVSTWGKTFLTVPLATRLKGDLFRILASEDNTKVSINGTLVATLARGKFFQTILTARSQITSTAPTLLSQFSVGTSFDGVDGDPFAMIIPPTEQFLNHYTFSTPDDTGFPRQFVNVVIPSGQIGTLQIDGAVVDGSKFSSIGDSGFSGGQLPVGPGSHTLRSTDGVPFGIYVYGFGFHDSYGYAGGMSFNAINPVGDTYPPGLRLVQTGDTVQGAATDSEDANANGILDEGEDLNKSAAIDRRNEDLNGSGKLDLGEDANGNGVLDRDTGIFKVELLPGSSNLQLDVLPFVPGVLSAQFSVARIDTTKPGVGTLQVQDGSGNKTTAPIEIGAVAIMQNVRVIATLSTVGIEVDTTSFKKQPYSISSGADQQIIEWRFDKFSADSGADLGFDVLLKNPLGGQKREVSNKIDLFYTNANGQTLHTALEPRFIDVLPSSFIITTSTDKASYVAGDSVNITSIVNSLSAVQSAVGVKLYVRDANNVLVADLGSLPSQTVPAGSTATFAGLGFSVTGIYVGSYKLIAELVDGNGVTLATGTVPFSVVAGTAASMKASIVTDKQIYSTQESVVLSDRLSSLSTNQALDNLSAVTMVTNADGTVRMTKTESIIQLPPGGVRDYIYHVPLASASPGQYGATLKISASDGTLLAQSATGFTVASSANTGIGLNGSITASPAQVPQGDSVSFAYGTTNQGNSSLADLPIKVSIVNPLAQQVLAEFPVTHTLAIGGVYNGDVNWITNGAVGDTYVALLTAGIADKTLTLAQANFTLLPPPVKLDVKQSIVNSSRVLVLVACNDGDDDTPKNGKSAACVSARIQTIEKMLAVSGVPHAITTEEAAFRKALRSGAYNTYWLSGKQDKLHSDLAGEVRELVFGGDALILDGVHDERNKTLDSVMAVLYKGKVGEVNLSVDISGAEFNAMHVATAGRAEKIELNGGTGQASFGGAQPTARGPAIVTNAYGSGRGVLFAFDLSASFLADPAWQPVLANAMKFALPASPTVLIPGALLRIDTSVANLNRAVNVQVKSILPPGALVLESIPAATIGANAGTIDWTFQLPETATQDLLLTFRLPPDAGDFAVTTAVSSARNGATTPYGDAFSLPISVAAAVPTAANAIDSLRTLPLVQTAEQNARDAIITTLQNAMNAFSQNTAAGYEAAISALVLATEQLNGLVSVDTSAVHLGIDRVMKEAQWRWVLLQPPELPH